MRIYLPGPGQPCPILGWSHSIFGCTVETEFTAVIIVISLLTVRRWLAGSGPLPLFIESDAVQSVYVYPGQQRLSHAQYIHTQSPL